MRDPSGDAARSVTSALTWNTVLMVILTVLAIGASIGLAIWNTNQSASYDTQQDHRLATFETQTNNNFVTVNNTIVSVNSTLTTEIITVNTTLTNEIDYILSILMITNHTGTNFTIYVLTSINNLTVAVNNLYVLNAALNASLINSTTVLTAAIVSLEQNLTALNNTVVTNDQIIYGLIAMLQQNVSAMNATFNAAYVTFSTDIATLQSDVAALFGSIGATIATINGIAAVLHNINLVNGNVGPVAQLVFGNGGPGVVTIAIGVVNATNGGTGQTLYTVGAMLYANTTTTLAQLPIGGASQLLAVVGGVPQWTNLGSLGVIVTSFATTLSGLSPQSAAFGAVTLSGVLGAPSGGTGLTLYAVGDLLVANATATLTRLAAGANGQVLTIVGGVPAWGSVGGSGVSTFQTSLSGLSPSTAMAGAITLSGVLGVPSGGTGLTSFALANSLLYALTTTSVGTIAPGTNGYVLTMVGGAPAWAAVGGSGVSTFQTSISGLSPSTATAGAVTLSGTVGVPSGGTGLTSFAAAGELLYSTGTTTLAGLPIGTPGQFLQASAGGLPTWASLTPSFNGIPVINLGPTPTGGESVMFNYSYNAGLNLGSVSPFTINANGLWQITYALGGGIAGGSIPTPAMALVTGIAVYANCSTAYIVADGGVATSVLPPVTTVPSYGRIGTTATWIAPLSAGNCVAFYYTLQCNGGCGSNFITLESFVAGAGGPGASISANYAELVRLSA
jgi:hypothetical protein